MLGSYLVRVRSDLPDGEVAGALEEVDTGATAVFHSGAELLRLLSLGVDPARRSAASSGELTADYPSGLRCGGRHDRVGFESHLRSAVPGWRPESQRPLGHEPTPTQNTTSTPND